MEAEGRANLDFREDPAVLLTVVDALADAVFSTDAQARIVAWSAGAERMTGHARDQVRGRSIRLLSGPGCEGIQKLEKLLANPAQAPAELREQECRILARDGRELHVLGNVRVIRDEDGVVRGTVGTFTDLTGFVASRRLAELDSAEEGPGGLVGASPPMREVFRRIRLAADSDVTTLVTGESGTGKELAARAIHDASARSYGPFLAVNCSALTESLLESELFGHVKGAFTGAARDRRGLFEAAAGGTLFLDEIGDVSPLLQQKLLRVLQEREVRRVGDDRPIAVDVRLVSATNQDLKQLLAAGRMREDFYYRIRVFEIAMPPLRERREDVPLLVRAFCDELAARLNRPAPGVEEPALAALTRYAWPGNVRELRNAIEHAFVSLSGDRLRLLDLPEEVRACERPAAVSWEPELSPRELDEREDIRRALERRGWNRTETARDLGISRVTLWKRMRRYGLAEPSPRR